jgi:phosphinothricin acetyltransferase
MPIGTPRVLIRPSLPTDLPAIQAIYAHAVQHGTGTFEIDAPDLAEMGRRREAIVSAGWPWLVAERDGRVLGFAYAGPFRPRRAYRFCLEDSIYLAEEARGAGVGRLLLAELIARCEALGARQMLAVIGDSANAASIGLHEALGFEPSGVLKSAGWKMERWLDVVLMQRALGQGATTAAKDRA